MFFRRWAAWAFLLLLLVISLMAPSVAGATGNLNVFFGNKDLDRDDWYPLEDQQEYGVQFDMALPDWPAGIAVNVMRSEESMDGDPLGLISGMRAETLELQVGAKKIWDVGYRAHPFIGGGITIIRGEMSSSLGFNPSPLLISTDMEYSDLGFGPWATAGVCWTFGGADAFNIGLVATWSSASLHLLNVKMDGGGTHLGLIVGYHWQ